MIIFTKHLAQPLDLVKGPPWWLLTIKNLPAKPETWVQSLDRDDHLEKGMATHSSILAWRIPWTSRDSKMVVIIFINSQVYKYIFLSESIKHL